MTDPLRRLGSRLKQLRQERRLTQEALAEAAGLSYKFIGEIERGSGNPTVTTLSALAGALEIEVSDLFASAQGLSRHVSAHDISMVREALDSIETFLNRASPARKITRYAGRRRKTQRP